MVCKAKATSTEFLVFQAASWHELSSYRLGSKYVTVFCWPVVFVENDKMIISVIADFNHNIVSLQ